MADEFVPPEAELRWTFGASGGPGGQHANRANTRAEVRWHAVTSAALTDEQRDAITSKLGPIVRAGADDTRSQHRNRQIALERLNEKVSLALQPQRARHQTKPSKSAHQRRLDAKRRRSERKRSRRPPQVEE